MNRITAAFVYCLLALFTLQSCVSAEKLIETGQYDAAIQLAQRKLSGKQRKNPKFVRAAEEAFAKITVRETRELDRLRRANREDSWGRINEITRNIRKRQNALQPLLPLTDKNGYTATFNFVQVDALEEESRDKAAAYHYRQAQDLLARAEQGDKNAARIAYDELKETLRYFRNYKDASALQQKAHNLGTVHVLVKVENNADVFTPAAFEQRLRQINTADLNNFWQQYHTSDRRNFDFDYEIKLRVTHIAVTPELVREREYVDQKNITDGREYVLDGNGNVLKDSLGNDVTIPREITIQAWVLETLQQKEAQVEGVVEVHSLRTGRLVRSQPLAASAIFENYASTFRGDQRALSSKSRQCIGNRPIPFPSNENLILQAADQLKPALLDRILDYNHLVQV